MSCLEKSGLNSSRQPTADRYDSLEPPGMNLVRARVLAVTLVVLEVCGCGPPSQGDWVRNRVQVLDQLRDDINAQYGFLETTPRVIAVLAVVLRTPFANGGMPDFARRSILRS